MRRKRTYKVRNIAMLEAFVDAIHDASPSKLRSDAKGAATRQIKRLKL